MFCAKLYFRVVIEFNDNKWRVYASRTVLHFNGGYYRQQWL